MEAFGYLGILWAICNTLAITTVVVSCTFCLRYLASFTTAEGIPLRKSRKNGHKRDNACQPGEGVTGAENAPQMTVIQIDVDPIPTEGDDLSDLKHAPISRDVKSFSDACSFSDVTTSPGESPLPSPVGTPRLPHKCLHRVHSAPHGSPALRQATPNTLSVQDPRRHSGEGFTESLPWRSPQKRRRSPVLKRSVSVPEILEQVSPKVTFTIHFDAGKNALKLEGIELLDVGLVGGIVTVQVDLLPTGKSVVDDTPPSTTEGRAALDGPVVFEELNEAELHRMSLLLTVSHLCTSQAQKRVSLGEALIQVSELHVNPDLPPLTVTRMLHHTRRIRKKSTSANSLFRDLGDLFVLLQYQSQANRIKIFVRKASGLPSGGKLPGQPDHVVVVKLKQCGRTVAARETRPQKGSQPVWNEPYLFDVGSMIDINDYSLELTVRRGRIYTKDSVLGHVTLGPKATRSGTAHWKEAVQPTGVEVAKWHPILPVLKY